MFFLRNHNRIEMKFVASLKKGYEPEGVDRLTERIVLMVEAGQI